MKTAHLPLTLMYITTLITDLWILLFFQNPLKLCFQTDRLKISSRTFSFSLLDRNEALQNVNKLIILSMERERTFDWRIGTYWPRWSSNLYPNFPQFIFSLIISGDANSQRQKLFWVISIFFSRTLTSMKREMVWMAWSLSLKASLQVYAVPAGLLSSEAFDRKFATSETRHSVPLSCAFRNAAPTLLWSKFCNQNTSSYVSVYTDTERKNGPKQSNV